MHCSFWRPPPTSVATSCQLCPCFATAACRTGAQVELIGRVTLGCVLIRRGFRARQPVLFKCSLEWRWQMAAARLASSRLEQASMSWPAGLKWPVDAQGQGRVCCAAHCRPGVVHCNGRQGVYRRAEPAPEGLEAGQVQQVHTQTGQAGGGLEGHTESSPAAVAAQPCSTSLSPPDASAVLCSAPGTALQRALCRGPQPLRPTAGSKCSIFGG